MNVTDKDNFAVNPSPMKPSLSFAVRNPTEVNVVYFCDRIGFQTLGQASTVHIPRVLKRQKQFPSRYSFLSFCAVW